MINIKNFLVFNSSQWKKTIFKNSTSFLKVFELHSKIVLFSSKLERSIDYKIRTDKQKFWIKKFFRGVSLKLSVTFIITFENSSTFNHIWKKIRLVFFGICVFDYIFCLFLFQFLGSISYNLLFQKIYNSAWASLLLKCSHSSPPFVTSKAYSFEKLVNLSKLGSLNQNETINFGEPFVTEIKFSKVVARSSQNFITGSHSLLIWPINGNHTQLKKWKRTGMKTD